MFNRPAMFNRQLLHDATLALLIALPTLALTVPGNAATGKMPAEAVTVAAETPLDRLQAAARAAGAQRVRS